MCAWEILIFIIVYVNHALLLIFFFFLTRVIAYETNCSKVELFFLEEWSHNKYTEICSTVEEGGKG